MQENDLFVDNAIRSWLSSVKLLILEQRIFLELW